MPSIAKLTTAALVAFSWIAAALLSWSVRQFSAISSVDVPVPTALLFSFDRAFTPWIAAAVVTALLALARVRWQPLEGSIQVACVVLLLSYALFSLWALALLVAPIG